MVAADMDPLVKKPNVRSVLGVPLTSLIIVVVELCERFGFYSLTSSKKGFLMQRLGFDSSRALILFNLWGTVVWFCAWFGGFCADNWIGRYKTVGIFATIYAAGMFLITLAALPSFNSSLFFFVGMFGLLPLGSGGIKPAVSVFGADQIQGPDSEATKARFYSMFYGTIMMGSMCSTLFMSSMATAPQDYGIPDQWGYFVAYVISTSCMLLGVTLFFGFSRYYLPAGKAAPRSAVGSLLVRAVATSTTKSFRGAVAGVGWFLTLPYFFTVIYGGIAGSPTIARCGLVLYLLQFASLIWAHSNNNWILPDQGENESWGELTIKQVRQSFQCFPLVLVVSATFTVIFRLASNEYVPTNACQMNLNIGDGKQVNSNTLWVFNPLAVMSSIFLLETFVYPAAQRRGRPISAQQKFLMGLSLAGLSALSALFIERARRGAPVLAPSGWTADAATSIQFPDMAYTDDLAGYMGQCLVNGKDYCSNCAKKSIVDADGFMAGIYMSDFSPFWMVIPFVLMGMAEACVLPVVQYIAYEFTPKPSRAIIQGVSLVFINAYPLALVTAFSTILVKFVSNDLNITKENFMGIHMGVDAYYWASLCFLIPAVPLLMLVNRIGTVSKIEDNEVNTVDS